MIFKQLFDNESSTYTYLLADEKSREAVLIDPVKENVESYIQLLASLELKLKFALETHVHADHITGSGLLREKTGCITAMHKSTAAGCVSQTLNDGEEISFGAYRIKLIHTPGHTPCSSSYLVEGRVFTGDCLLINGCGRTDFQQGSAKDEWHSVTQKLFFLPDETLVYPAHDYHKRCVSSIKQEKNLNTRFLGQTEASFIELMNNLNLPDPKKIHEAVPANQVCGLV